MPANISIFLEKKTEILINLYENQVNVFGNVWLLDFSSVLLLLCGCFPEMFRNYILNLYSFRI